MDIHLQSQFSTCKMWSKQNFCAKCSCDVPSGENLQTVAWFNCYVCTLVQMTETFPTNLNGREKRFCEQSLCKLMSANYLSFLDYSLAIIYPKITASLKTFTVSSYPKS